MRVSPITDIRLLNQLVIIYSIHYLGCASRPACLPGGQVSDDASALAVTSLAASGVSMAAVFALVLYELMVVSRRESAVILRETSILLISWMACTAELWSADHGV